MKNPYQIAALTAALLVSGVAVQADERDDRIEAAFKDSYTYRSHLRNQDVSVDVKNGVATLSGRVENEDQKRLAEDTARGLEGVTSVDNRLKLANEPKESSDDWIALKVRSALLFHKDVGIRDTDVQVLNGVVTLTGVASSDAEKALATEYAQDIKGVKRVDNQLKVVADRRTARQAELETRSESNVHAVGADVRAAGREARNETRSAVREARSEAEEAGNEARREAREAKNEARDEVREVRREADRDIRNANAETTRSARTTGDRIDDASITAQLKSSLAVRRSTGALRTDITTRNGVVTVRGEAKNKAEKDLVTQIAREINGVREVNNEMSVQGNN